MDLPEHKNIVLFDGICNLCNKSIIFIIKRDYKDVFRFAPIQSEIGKKLISTLKIDTVKVDSILLYIPKNEKLHTKSNAVLRIAQELKFPYNICSCFLIFPAFLRNSVYDYIAKKRYNWFGKQNTCMIPTPDLNKKFLL